MRNIGMFPLYTQCVGMGIHVTWHFSPTSWGVATMPFGTHSHLCLNGKPTHQSQVILDEI